MTHISHLNSFKWGELSLGDCGLLMYGDKWLFVLIIPERSMMYVLINIGQSCISLPS